MCGIVGYVGKRPALPLLLDKLKKLEYRGYDSAGVALINDEGLWVRKREGRIANLEEMLSLEGCLGETCVRGAIGIGHTRWATHGKPSDENAHPHEDCSHRFAVVHNGIIENFVSLREWLVSRGHVFSSETDTEVLPHLIEEFYSGDLLGAVAEALNKVQGSFAIAVISKECPDRIVAARKDSPLVIGLGSDENHIASDIPALLADTRRVIVLNDGELAEVTGGAVRVMTLAGSPVTKEILEVKWDPGMAERGGYEHFMLKEIHEEPRAIRDTLSGRINPKNGEVNLEELTITPHELEKIRKISFIACGTAYHACLVGRHVMERIVRISADVSLGSEFRYSDPMVGPDTLVIVISQSGETADTLAALREAKQRGSRILAITNVVGSSVAREADDVLYTWAGPEIAVASTKTYITQLVQLYLLAVALGRMRGTLSRSQEWYFTDNLRTLPQHVDMLFGRHEDTVREFAYEFKHMEDVFFIGRGLDYAVAMEGSLKLKEVSYIRAEAYAAGELKHGTLALIVPGVPVFALITQRDLYDKMLGNIKEVKARGARVIALTMEGDEEIAKSVDHVIHIPPTDSLFTPVLSVVPLQLFAYYAACARGCDVDRPRNLAKSVTVE